MPPDQAGRPRAGFFSKLKGRLNRGKAWLTEDLLSGKAAALDEATLDELETQLIMSDAGIEATEWLLGRLRRGGGEHGSARDALKAAVRELLEPLEVPLNVATPDRPFVILAIGVNGTGKTTTIGKLAHRFGAEGASVLLAAGDTFRAAAVEQLEAWSQRAGAAFVAQQTGADPAAVIHDALAAARARGIDVVLADTAGRLHTASNLMDELDKVRRTAAKAVPGAPHEVLLVLDASQGQNALEQALKFHARIHVTGLVLTKLDGTARGGIVLAIARRLGIPIRFIAVGEGIEDLDVFRAADFADALVGGDAP